MLEKWLERGSDNLIIKQIRRYFLDCPLIDEESKINVDYLGVGAVEYSIDPVPSDSLVKKYMDGGAVKQYLFVFGSREYYGDDTLQNMENSGFYQIFSDWVEEQNKIGNLPELSKGKQALKIETVTSGYLFHADESSAKYQIQMRLTYYED